MVLTNNTNIPRATTETTVTTRTTEIGSAIPQQQILQKNPIITNVQEKPILEQVIEKRNVEVHHKPVVQEIHEQKIIEIEKQPLIQNVQQQTLVQQSRTDTRFEEIGTAELSEQERLRLSSLNMARAPVITQQQGAIRQVNEGEQVSQVVRQEFIEHHVQPVITEVREQNIIQTVEQPIVRKIHETPIIREVVTQSVQQPILTNTTQLPMQQGFVQQSGIRTTGTTFTQPIMTGSTMQQPIMTGSTLQQPMMSGIQQPGVVHKQGGVSGLVQNVKDHLHMGNNTTSTTTGSALAGSALNQQFTSGSTTLQPMMSGSGSTIQQPLMSGSGIQQPLMSGSTLQQPMMSGSGLPPPQSGLINQQQSVPQKVMQGAQSMLSGQQTGLNQQGGLLGNKLGSVAPGAQTTQQFGTTGQSFNQL